MKVGTGSIEVKSVDVSPSVTQILGMILFIVVLAMVLLEVTK